MGISITDGAKLFKNGYSLSDMKELNIILDKNPDNSNDIVDLAKKLQFSDLKQALTLFSISADKPSENDNADEDDEDAPGDDEETQNKHTPADDHSEDDNIDYKKKYEEENGEFYLTAGGEPEENDSNKENPDMDVNDILRMFFKS